MLYIWRKTFGRKAKAAGFCVTRTFQGKVLFCSRNPKVFECFRTSGTKVSTELSTLPAKTPEKQNGENHSSLKADFIFLFWSLSRLFMLMTKQFLASLANLLFSYPKKHSEGRSLFTNLSFLFFSCTWSKASLFFGKTFRLGCQRVFLRLQKNISKTFMWGIITYVLLDFGR